MARWQKRGGVGRFCFSHPAQHFQLIVKRIHQQQNMNTHPHLLSAHFPPHTSGPNRTQIILPFRHLRLESMTPQADTLHLDGSWSPQIQGPGAVHTCPQTDCNRQFNRKYTLIEHLKTHTGEKPHACPVRSCGKRFSTSGNLSRHKRLHGTIEPLECPVEGCACTFPSDNKLEKHMKFHLGSAVHVCVVRGCGKTFSTTGNLNRHLKHHHHGLKGDSMSSSPSSPNFLSHQSPTSADQLPNSSSADHSSWWFPAAEHDDPMVPTMDQLDALTAIFDEEIATPMTVEAEIPRVSILDDMISFHVTHIGVHY